MEKEGGKIEERSGKEGAHHGVEEEENERPRRGTKKAHSYEQAARIREESRGYVTRANPRSCS